MEDGLGRRAEGGWERGLEGLAGPVKRFGLYLTEDTEPLWGFRRGSAIGSLAFQQDLSNHSLKNGLDKAGSCKQAVYGGRGEGGRESRREMVWQGLEQCVEKSGRIKDQLKGYNWQAAVTAWMQGGRASKEKSQGGTLVPTLDNAWMLVLVFKPENTGRAAV